MTEGDDPSGVPDQPEAQPAEVTLESAPAKPNRRPVQIVLGLAAALVVALIAFAVLAGGGGGLTDPNEIIIQGLTASRQGESGHVVMTLEGTISEPSSGMELSLDGSTIEGDFDSAQPAAALTFSFPSLLGLHGEVRIIGEDMYLKSSLTGPRWTHQTTGDSGLPIPEPTASADPEQQIRDFLETDGVSTAKLPDADCGEATCYHVTVTIDPSVIAGAQDMGDVIPPESISEPVVIDLLFDRDRLWLVEASATVVMDGSEITVHVTLSDLGQPVTVEPPPAAEVDEGSP